MKILLWDIFDRVIDSIKHLMPGSEVVAAETFQDLVNHSKRGAFDCIIADISGSQNPVSELITQIRQNQRTTGLILLSSSGSIQEKVEALQTGADDFVTVPFEISEMAARILAVVRRVKSAKNTELSHGEIRISLHGKQVFVNEREIGLTRKELELLLYFIEHKNSVVSKESLVSFLASTSLKMDKNIDILYAHIKNLKRKLVEAGCKPYLKTVYGIGYKWEGS